MNTMNLGRVLRLLRVEKGMRQTELARQAGVSQSTLSAMENGASLTSENVTLVASALGTNASSLYKIAEAMSGVTGANEKAVELADNLARLLDPAEMDDLFAKAAKETPAAERSNTNDTPSPKQEGVVYRVRMKPRIKTQRIFHPSAGMRSLTRLPDEAAYRMAITVEFQKKEATDGSTVLVPIVTEAHGIDGKAAKFQIQAIKKALARFSRLAAHGMGELIEASGDFSGPDTTRTGGSR